ncbi:MAG: hypothetical protein ACTSRZ_18295 [Promethearchaeota archaeon]
MKFEYFTTCYPPYTNEYPIAYDYSEVTPSKLKRLKEHNNKILVHSGNWWSMKHPEKRTPDAILENTKKIIDFLKGNQEKQQPIKLKYQQRSVNRKFIGLMSCNEQPYLDKKTPYWILNEDKLIIYIEKCLDNADYMLDNKDFPGKLYCTIQVANAKQARKYFREALDRGHKYFAIGVSEFLRYPKFKFKGIKRIFEITKAVRSEIGEKYELHLSGISAFSLIPFIYVLGATSCDGSTPVQSALAYGTVFNSQGKGISASKLKELGSFLKLFSKLENKDMGFLELEDNDPLIRNSAFNWFFTPLNLSTNLNASSDSPNYPNNSNSQPNNLNVTNLKKKIIPFRLFKCNCDVCYLKTIAQRTHAFNEGTLNLSNSASRVIHNLKVWNNLIKYLNKVKSSVDASNIENIEKIKKKNVIEIISKQIFLKNNKYLNKLYSLFNEINK